MPSTKSTRVRKTVPAKKALQMPGPIGPKAMAIGAAVVIAGGILVAARQQTVPQLTTTPRLEIVAAPEIRAKAAPVMTSANAASAAVGASARSAAAPVTLTGCLEREGDGFRLKDAAGAAAPKSRSWKSGFMKKGTASVDVVDAAHALRLADQVNHRVSVTGPLVDRSMSARSLRRVSASCDK